MGFGKASGEARAPIWSPGVFALAIVGSACLIFLVQPMVAKRILPWFGGTPGVWMVCLAFYQTALFLGYAYAHALVRWVPPLGQAVVHSALLAAAISTLPILPTSEAMSGGVTSPTADILWILLANVAVPFMVLAATGPLVQAWFARSHPDRSPYPLYALSNVGSMAALFAYPFFIERHWSVSDSGRGWGAGLIVVGALIALSGFLAARARTRSETPAGESGGEGSVGDVVSGPTVSDESATRTEPAVVVFWLLLSGAAVVLMMGISNRLCLDVASIPFLWIYPLSIYLLTFILCFADERWYRRRLYLSLALVALVVSAGKKLVLVGLGLEQHRLADSIQTEIGVYGVLLFSTCMVMHGELYRLRPPAERLTAFYLVVSAGGALGGLSVGLLAPAIFDNYYELEVGLVLVIGCCAALLYRYRTTLSARTTPISAIALGCATALVLGQLWGAGQYQGTLIHIERSFFGVMRVFEIGEGASQRRRLRHGSTLHGTQFRQPPGSLFPTSYFGRASSLGSVLVNEVPRRQARVGIVGLGVGTIAAYGRPGDVMRFYEIDPAVDRVARQAGYFTFLTDSAATTEVELGDARLVMEREQASGARQDYDVLIVDAFSSDSIPAHLMTREAFEVYRSALAKGGLIGVHISNRHLDLGPVVARIGDAVGLASVKIITPRIPEFRTQLTSWVYLSPSRARLDALERMLRNDHARLGIESDTRTFTATRYDQEMLESTPLWTDDFADLFSAVKPL